LIISAYIICYIQWCVLLRLSSFTTGTSSYRPKRKCEFADRMVFSSKVWFPGCRKKQRLISSGLRKLQPPEWPAFKPSLSCIDKR